MNNVLFFLTAGLFVCLLPNIFSQKTISFSSRNLLNNKNEIRIRSNLDRRQVFSSLGFILEYSRDKEMYRFNSFAGGFNYFNSTDIEGNGVPEFFIQAKFKLFNSLVKFDGFDSYFSFGPRFIFMYEKIPINLICGCPETRRLYGLELPLVLNIERRINNKINFVCSLNTLVPYAFFIHQKLDDQSTNPLFLTNQIFSKGSLNIFNEIRLGVSFNL